MMETNRNSNQLIYVVGAIAGGLVLMNSGLLKPQSNTPEITPTPTSQQPAPAPTYNPAPHPSPYQQPAPQTTPIDSPNQPVSTSGGSNSSPEDTYYQYVVQLYSQSNLPVPDQAQIVGAAKLMCQAASMGQLPAAMAQLQQQTQNTPRPAIQAGVTSLFIGTKIFCPAYSQEYYSIAQQYFPGLFNVQ
jgi:hypothetical protein